MATMNVYIRMDKKVKIMRKAQKYRISMSELLVKGALNYTPVEEEKNETEQSE